jgi:hypothetical protein
MEQESYAHVMNKRPLSVTIISGLFIAAGVIGLAYHVTELKTQGGVQYEVVWVLLLRLMAIVCGVYMLRGSNWARWLTMLWMAYHVILSGFHSLQELVLHGFLFAVFAYFLFRAGATEYFRRAGENRPT